MTGHAKVLKQHIPWKYIAIGQIFDCVAIIAHGRSCRTVGSLANINVQWDHAPFYIGMLDDDVIPTEGYGFRSNTH